MTSRVCTRCSASLLHAPSHHRLCKTCWSEQRVETLKREAFEHGYRQGLAVQPLNGDRVRQLLQLCHPDKHNGSRTSLEVTQWLLSLPRAGRS